MRTRRRKEKEQRIWGWEDRKEKKWEEGGVVGWDEGEGKEGVGWYAKGVIWSFYEELKKLGCKS